MKWLNFNLTAVAVMALAMLLQPRDCHAQESADSIAGEMHMVTATTLTDNSESDINPAYYRRLQKRQEHWDKLIPNLFTLQYAGDIGLISAGLGWDYGRSNQWETHLLVGFLPKRFQYHHYWTLTLRQTYAPWNLHFTCLNQRWSVKPLFVNLSLNSILHGAFWTSEPDRYPHGYYGFSSRLRFHLGIGQRFSFHIPEQKRFLSRKVSVYYEISTCDLYVRQKAISHSIPLKDILAIGVGVIYTI